MVLLCVSALAVGGWLAWLYFVSDLPSIDARHLSESAFEAKYGQRIFRYRWLSRAALGALSGELSGLSGPTFAARWSPFLLAMFLLNVAFLVLTTWQLFHLVYRSRFCRAAIPRRGWIFGALVAAVALTGVTVTAYDFLAYYLLLVTAWLIYAHAERRRPALLIAVVVLTALATINRETAALGVALFATLHLSRYGLRLRALGSVLVVVLAFSVPYVGLRLALGWSHATHNRVLLAHNFGDPLALLGIAVWIVGTASCIRWARSPDNRRWVVLFNVLAAPYTMMCLYTGRMEELRLFVPMLLVDVWLAIGRMPVPMTGEASRGSMAPVPTVVGSG